MSTCANVPPAPRPPDAVDPTRHLGLAAAVARRFVRPGIEFDDLVQAARLGLVEAARRFEPSRGVQFTTYALPFMVGEVRRLIDRSRAVSGIRGARSLIAAAAARRDALQQALGRPPTLQEVASSLHIDPSELAAAHAAFDPPAPVEGPEGSDIPAGPAGSREEGEEDVVRQIWVRHALAALPPALTTVLVLRFFRGYKQAEVARHLGISQSAVSRREREALLALRRHLYP